MWRETEIQQKKFLKSNKSLSVSQGNKNAERSAVFDLFVHSLTYSLTHSLTHWCPHQALMTAYPV